MQTYTKWFRTDFCSLLRRKAYYRESSSTSQCFRSPDGKLTSILYVATLSIRITLPMQSDHYVKYPTDNGCLL